MSSWSWMRPTMSLERTLRQSTSHSGTFEGRCRLGNEIEPDFLIRPISDYGLLPVTAVRKPVYRLNVTIIPVGLCIKLI